MYAYFPDVKRYGRFRVRFQSPFRCIEMQYLLDFVCVIKVFNMHDTRVFMKVLSTQKHDALILGCTIWV